MPPTSSRSRVELRDRWARHQAWVVRNGRDLPHASRPARGLRGSFNSASDARGRAPGRSSTDGKQAVSYFDNFIFPPGPARALGTEICARRRWIGCRCRTHPRARQQFCGATTPAVHRRFTSCVSRARPRHRHGTAGTPPLPLPRASCIRAKASIIQYRP